MKRTLALATLLVATSSCAALLGTDLDGLRPKEETDARSSDADTADAYSLDNSSAGDELSDGGEAGGDPVAGEADRRYAQWPVPPPSPPVSSYDVTSATIRDSITGLMWARTVSETELRWSDAMAYCANFTHAGYDDWRLPTRIELFSIVDYGATSEPMMPAVGFDGSAVVPDKMTYWSASRLPTTQATVRFAVNFSDAKLVSRSPEQSALVRCVRGGAIGSAPRWVVSGTTAKDTFTGLEWHTTAVVFPKPTRPAMGTLAEAKQACAERGGFHVPTIRELHTIYDEQAPMTSNNALDTMVPWTLANVWKFWSAQANPASPSRTYVFDFYYSTTFDYDTEAGWYASLCVR